MDLLPGCLFDNGGDRRVDLLLGRVLELHGAKNDLASSARAAGIVGRLLDHVKVYDYRPEPAVEQRYSEALRRSEAIFTKKGAAEVPVSDRILAAEALGQGGDRRLRSFVANLLPVPGKPTLLLGKYPVTVQEYQEFVDDRGYEHARFWSTAGWAEKERGGWEAPGSWERQLQTPNRPVVEVSWYEAEAYCTWRSHVTGRNVRLPTEDEWYAAARPAEGDYPWGREEPTPDLANFGRNVGAPTPVGIYPAGAGRGGHLDLAGNVWEWCFDEVPRPRGPPMK